VALAQLARGQRDPQQRGRALRVVAERLVKVAEPKEDDGIRVLAFDPLVLLENRDRLQWFGPS
jgi:hypothetical protein